MDLSLARVPASRLVGMGGIGEEDELGFDSNFGESECPDSRTELMMPEQLR